MNHVPFSLWLAVDREEWDSNSWVEWVSKSAIRLMHLMIWNRHTSDNQREEEKNVQVISRTERICISVIYGTGFFLCDTIWQKIIDVEVDQHTEKCSTQSKVLKVKISLMSCALLCWNLWTNFEDFWLLLTLMFLRFRLFWLCHKNLSENFYFYSIYLHSLINFMIFISLVCNFITNLITFGALFTHNSVKIYFYLFYLQILLKIH